MNKPLNHQEILQHLLKRAVGTIFQCASLIENYRLNPIAEDKEKIERISTACLTLNDIISVVHQDLAELLPDLKKEQIDYLIEVQRKHLEMIGMVKKEEEAMGNISREEAIRLDKEEKDFEAKQ